MKMIGKYLFALFFVVAGANHFINPHFYLPLIPPVFPYPEIINLVAGVVEIVLGVGLALSKFQKYAAYGIVLLMIAFIPSHVYFIQIGGCVKNGLCVSPWIAWVRLLVVHPLLIGLGYYFRKT
jgi:uncharacterized membrane protein